MEERVLCVTLEECMDSFVDVCVSVWWVHQCFVRVFSALCLNSSLPPPLLSSPLPPSSSCMICSSCRSFPHTPSDLKTLSCVSLPFSVLFCPVRDSSNILSIRLCLSLSVPLWFCISFFTTVTLARRQGKSKEKKRKGEKRPE